VTSKRTTTLGYGTKFDFTKNGKAVPPPNTYTLKDEFSDGKKKGKSFGLSREVKKISHRY